MKQRFYRILITAFFFILTSGLVLSQESKNVKTPDGSYQPGLVLVFDPQSDSWRPASPEKINYANQTLVYIHGAHSKIDKSKTTELARAALKHNPKLNVMAIDWERWAAFSDVQIEEVLVEEAAKWFDDLDPTDEDFAERFEEALDNFIPELALRVLGNIIPLEQTNNIPEVAARAEKILFGRKGSEVSITTDFATCKAIALGLEPSRVWIVAFSHGAHLAGLLAEKAIKNRSKKIRRITALDPSVAALQQSEENYEGKGWGPNSAEFVDVYRTSELCSESERLYGDYNLYLRDNDHPLLNLDAADNLLEAIDMLSEGVACDIELHKKCVDIFINMLSKDLFWDWPEEVANSELGRLKVVDLK